MTELEFLNMVTTIIQAHATLLNVPANSIKYPNTDIDMSSVDQHIEILYTNYTNAKINLKGNKRIFGCITFKVVGERGIGLKSDTELAINMSLCLSGKIISGVVFEEYDLKVLNHTLSQTQTTTDIPFNQVNANVEFSYMR